MSRTYADVRAHAVRAATRPQISVSDDEVADADPTTNAEIDATPSAAGWDVPSRRDANVVVGRSVAALT